MSADDELRRIVDESAIVDVAVRYCWTLDTRDWGGLVDVFLPDATANLGGRTVLAGIDAITQRCRSTLSRLDLSQHLVSTHQVAIDGDEATHRCHFQAQHVRSGAEGGDNYIVGGRYEDRLRRTGDGWRIAHRDLVVMWTEGNPVVIAP